MWLSVLPNSISCWSRYRSIHTLVFVSCRYSLCTARLGHNSTSDLPKCFVALNRFDSSLLHISPFRMSPYQPLFTLNSHPVTAVQVVVFMPEGDRTRMGGTMRLGSRVTVLRPGSRAFELYGGKGTEELEVRCRSM